MKRVLLVVAILLGVALGALFLFLDTLVIQTVERGGKYALGVDTRLESVDIELRSGQFGLHGLSIDNPPGFEREHFFEMSQGLLAVEARSLLQDIVRMPLIEMRGVRIDLDKNRQGSNYQVLLDNLARVSDGEPEEPTTTPEPPPEPAPDPEEEGRTLHIERIALLDIEVHVRLASFGGDVTRISIRTEEILIASPADMTVAETYSLIVRALLSTVVTNGAGLLPEDVLQDLGGQLARLPGAAFRVPGTVVRTVNGVAVEAASRLGEAGQAVGGKVGEALKDVGKELQKGVDKLLKEDP